MFPDLLRAKSGQVSGEKCFTAHGVVFARKASFRATDGAHTDHESELTTRTTWQPASGKALFRSGPPGWLAPLQYRRWNPCIQPRPGTLGKKAIFFWGISEVPWSLGEFARRRECSSVFNAFALDRLRKRLVSISFLMSDAR